MSAVALYTFGLLDPVVEPGRLADFVRRGGEIYRASDLAPGFLGRAATESAEPETHTPGEDYGPWGHYAVPDLEEFAGRDRSVHIATLSRWRDVESARSFVYRGIHRDALRYRYDWFLAGPWPGHVLWDVDDAVTPMWADGVNRYEALARDGVSPERFTFTTRSTA